MHWLLSTTFGWQVPIAKKHKMIQLGIFTHFDLILSDIITLYWIINVSM